MTIEEIQSICQKFKGVTSDIKWGEHVCFNVGGKMFLITAPDQFPPSASIKVSDEEFVRLPDIEGIIPAPYLARHKWVRLNSISIWTFRQWEHYIETAYKLVFNKLPGKTKKEITISTKKGTRRVHKGKKKKK